MKVQLISENSSNLYLFDKIADVNDLSNPVSFDNYDINVIDFGTEKMWRNCFNVSDKINRDLENIKNMINNTKSILIIVFPQNIKVGECKDEAKNHILRIKNIIANCLNISSSYSVFYDNCGVDLLNNQCVATFAFESDNYQKMIYNKTNKPVAIKKDNIIITSINIIDKTNINILNAFLHIINTINDDEEIPDWVYKYNFYNDYELNEKIDISKEIIKNEKEKIQSCQMELDSNLNYKKILFSTGDNLVEQVFKIIENIFDISLDDFNDKKKEDFLFKKDGNTYIGEIKGVNTNVRSEYISQLSVHVSQYKDLLQDEGKTENVIPLLIINYERNKEVDERDDIHQNQIQLAIKLNEIIIDCVTLLKLFDDILSEKISRADAIDKIINSNGILNY